MKLPSIPINLIPSLIFAAVAIVFTVTVMTLLIPKETIFGVSTNTKAESWYSLAQEKLILRDYQGAYAALDEYQKLDSDPRGDYLRGLTAGYNGDYSLAEKSFESFINNANHFWAGYLDLAWVQFKQGKNDEALLTLEKGVNFNPQNAWLLGSYGVTLNIDGQQDKAVKVLTEARELADELTLQDWAVSYSANDPLSYAVRIQEFKDLLDYNLKVAMGGEDPVAAVELQDFISKIGGVHPSEGVDAGVVVSACGGTCTRTSEPNACGETQTVVGTETCSWKGISPTTDAYVCNCSLYSNPNPPALPDGYGDTCTVTNACGVTTSGTIGCDGTCQATDDLLPAGYGTACNSPANACGVTTSGTIGCDGLCNAQTAPALPTGYGTSCTSAPNSCGMTDSTGTIDCSGSCTSPTPRENMCGPTRYGCTDSTANNYDSRANRDNGSCRYTIDVLGCTDPSAINYDASATVNNSSCYYSALLGCGDPSAVNFNPTLSGDQIDDSLCLYGIAGCTNPSASNFNPFAVVDDGSCTITCPSGYTQVGDICLRPGAIAPRLECSRDQDWTDNDNSCDQIFTLQSTKEVIYMRAVPVRAGFPSLGGCNLTDYRWEVQGGSNVNNATVGNQNPTMSFASNQGQEVTVKFTPDATGKLFNRPVQVSGTPVGSCTADVGRDVLKVRLVDIDLIED